MTILLKIWLHGIYNISTLFSKIGIEMTDDVEVESCQNIDEIAKRSCFDSCQQQNPIYFKIDFTKQGINAFTTFDSKV